MRLFVLVCAAALLAGSAVSADYFAPSPYFDGEISWTFPISPGGFIGGMDVLGNGDVVFSENGNLHRISNGQLSMLRPNMIPVWSSFVVDNPNTGRIIFSESMSYSVSSVDYEGNNEILKGTASGSYDAAVDGNGRLFVSMASSFTGPTQVALFDTKTGATRAIAQFEGPTGPVAFDAFGNLYYATASSEFGKIGGQSIYRIGPSQIESALSSGTPLDPNVLEVIVSDIDTASGMIALPDGRLLFSSSVTSPGSIMQVVNGSVDVFASLNDPFLFPTNLAYYQGSVFVNVGGVYGEGFAPYGVVVQLVPEPATLTSLALLTLAGAGLTRKRKTRV